ncbi:MAG: hypothetical protein JWN76_2100 [Chitinophagaceae bacterium]|nr:hypothetical protein [Chitinophagaceae bacterium]
MARISLKNILGKKNDTAAIFLSLIAALPGNTWIEDDKGQPVLGSSSETCHEIMEIKHEEELLGFVKGDVSAVPIAALLNQLLEKEAEKKKLGAEILNLYQEINMIFNFSDKLAQSIDAFAIAEVTLSQARHIIQSNAGVVLLLDEDTGGLQVAAVSGEPLLNEKNIHRIFSVMQSLLVNGQSEIITNTVLLKEAGIISATVQSVICAALKVKQNVTGAVILFTNESVSYTAGHLKILTTLALQSSAAIESALLYEKNIKAANDREEAIRCIYEVTSKFVPYEFIDALGHKIITDVKLGDQVEKVVTVLFSDMRGYTTLSEGMSPAENFKFVCSFNERMGPIIRKYNGFINQYLGDAIMAIFPGKAEDALSAAVAMQKDVREFNKLRLANNQLPIRIGVGMHTGPLIMGITGDQSRMDATTIADTVNTASRLESLTNYYKGDIIISQATFSQLPSGTFHTRPLASVQLKGKNEPVLIHECFSGFSEEEVEKKSITLYSFNQGITSYVSSSFHEAATAFQQVLQTNPADQTADFFLQKINDFLDKGAPLNWSGVEEMHTK